MKKYIRANADFLSVELGRRGYSVLDRWTTNGVEARLEDIADPDLPVVETLSSYYVPAGYLDEIDWGDVNDQMHDYGVVDALFENTQIWNATIDLIRAKYEQAAHSSDYTLEEQTKISQWISAAKAAGLW